MRISGHSLRTKLLMTTFAFLLILASALTWMVTQGFRKTQQNVKEQSIAGLQSQGSDSLQALTEREAQLTTLFLQQPALASRTAAEYLSAIIQSDETTPDSPGRGVELTTHADGHTSDLAANRRSDLFVPNFVSLHDPEIQRTINESSGLDTLAPTLLEQYPQTVAVYYVSKQDIARYYPAHTLEGNVPPDLQLSLEPWFAPSGPEANPERNTIWSPLYLDDAGNGLMITTCSPVYQQDIFSGVVCLDVTLQQMVDHLNELKPTPNSYAFITDNDGRMIAGSPMAIRELTGSDEIPVPEDPNQPIGLTIAESEINRMVQSSRNDIHNITVGDEPAFLSLSILPDLQWHLGIVAPIAEVTEQSVSVVSAIQEVTNTTLNSTIVAIGIFFIIALIGTTLFSLHLTRPISSLVAGTRRVASGDLDTPIPVQSSDELGVLATSFNQMIEELYVQRQTSESARLSAEQSNRAKSEFIANMSHELRTPLTAIIGYSDLLSYQARENARINSVDVENIRRAGKHLLALINDILDISKVEAGRMDLDYQPLMVKPLVEEVVATVQPLIEKNDNCLNVTCEEIHTALVADETKLRQVLFNLMSNAAKFTDCGEITLNVRREQDEDQSGSALMSAIQVSV